MLEEFEKWGSLFVRANKVSYQEQDLLNRLLISYYNGVY